MMKDYQKILFTIILSLFSLYYTNKGIALLKKTNPLMQQIIKQSSLYEKDAIDAIITNNYIIPGNSGLKINYDKSYDKMKKLGVFNETLLVFDKVLPNKSIAKQYQKIILNGNPYKNQVSLIYNIKDTAMYYKIETLLAKYDLLGNYYFNQTFIENNQDIINQINGNILSNKAYNRDNFYCITRTSIDNDCIKLQKHTILLKQNIQKYHFTYTKNNLHKGLILFYTINENNLSDLELIINYIKRNNYQIVTIEEIIGE